MDLLQWERNPWGQDILVRISWDLLWAAAIAGALFIVAHLIFRRVWLGRIAAGPADAAGPPRTAVPARVVRHSAGARAFHAVMAAAMIVLLVTSFLPVLGIRFAWVTLHWVAGLVLIATVLGHVVHATVWGDWRAVAMARGDLADVRRRLRRALGQPTEPPAKPAKYPLPNRLYHHVTTITAGIAIGTGVLMMVRVPTPFFTRNPYLLADSTWGWVYVAHGLSAVLFVTLVMAHVYFAILPEKRWMTRSMVRGWISRDEYLQHHDPTRWPAGAASEGGDE